MRANMKSGLMAVLLAFSLADRTPAGEAASFEQRDGSLAIRIGERPFATYVWNDPAVKRPYFANIHAPGGAQVTRNYPPVEGRDATDHATMHPGLWLAFGDVGGADFWRNKGLVEQVELIQKPTTSSDRSSGSFAVKNRYLADGKPVCQEICRIRVLVRPAGTLIAWDSRFSGDNEFSFGDQEEMGLGVRVATPLTVKAGGQIVNSDGLKNEPQVWGKQADWCDYAGAIDRQPLGVLLVPEPANFRRSWFHSRDYGVLVANPFGQKAFTKGPASKVTVRRGESLRLRFGILIHSGPIDLAAAYQDCKAVLAAED